MFLDKSLNIALVISAIFHLTIFLPLAHLRSPSFKKTLPILKITYLRPQQISPKKVRLKENPQPVARKQAKNENSVAKLKADSSVKQENVVKKMVSIPKPSKEKQLSQTAKIEIPPELPKEKEALYLNYYHSIREEIRRFVVKNYPRFIACGEVCLYFVLSSEGKLKEITIVEKRSSQNRLLKEIARKSVQQASPFLPFPKDLSSPQLSFNVLISFELEN